MRSSQRQPAFTIIETLVAMTITLVMLFLIHTLFQITSKSVSLGVGLSDIIGTSRAIGDQIERDAKQMFPPLPNTPPGVMVIVCERLDNIKYRERNGVIKTRKVRVDQLMFTRGPARSTKSGGPGLGATPIAPAGVATFAPPLYNDVNETNPVAAVRIYYGHGVATEPNGVCTSLTLGAAGTNAVATFWPLCRHALFFLEHADNATSPAINVAAGAAYNSAVSGITHPGVGSLLLHHGTTDVANIGYYSTSATLPNTNGVLISDGVGNTGVLNTGAMGTAYRPAAIAMTFDAQRLWVNKHPDVDVAAPLPAGLIAQMHPIIAENCSDFIVEFAGDYLDDATPVGPDGGPDVDGQSEIKWYGLEANPATNTYAFPGASYVSPTDDNPMEGSGSKVTYVFRHDQPAQWPYLIRIRYRLHDKRGELQGSYSPETELAAPDSEGRTGTNYGRWFEQIIKVNR